MSELKDIKNRASEAFKAWDRKRYKRAMKQAGFTRKSDYELWLALEALRQNNKGLWAAKSYSSGGIVFSGSGTLSTTGYVSSSVNKVYPGSN
jgi:hypothetical protein